MSLSKIKDLVFSVFLQKNKGKNIPGEENQGNKDSTTQSSSEITNDQNMKKFDIVIFSDDEGRTSQRVENGIFALNAQQLRSIYEATGEKIQILREYQDPTPQPTNTVAPKNPNPGVPEQNHKPETPPQPAVAQPQKPKKPTAKFFRICGTECKFEDNKIYQKQWVKILGNEASQYRLISDSTNKEISLNGKHLEMLKWVMVQDDPEQMSDLDMSILKILNN